MHTQEFITLLSTLQARGKGVELSGSTDDVIEVRPLAQSFDLATDTATLFIEPACDSYGNVTSIEASLLVGDEPVPAPSGNGTIVSYEIDHDDTLRYITDQLEDLLDHPLDHAEDKDTLQDITERLEDLLDHLLDHPLDHDDALEDITERLKVLDDRLLGLPEDDGPLEDITERLEDLLDHLLDHPEDDDTLQDTTDWLESQLDRLLDHADDIWEHQ